MNNIVGRWVKFIKGKVGIYSMTRVVVLNAIPTTLARKGIKVEEIDVMEFLSTLVRADEVVSTVRHSSTRKVLEELITLANRIRTFYGKEPIRMTEKDIITENDTFDRYLVISVDLSKFGSRGQEIEVRPQDVIFLEIELYCDDF